MDQTAAVKERQPLWMPSSIRRHRRLGEVFAAPRNSHMVYMPAALFTVGLLCEVIPTDFMLIVGALLLSAFTLWMMFGLLLRRAPIRMSTMMVMSMGLAYGIGTANSWFSIKRNGIGLAVYLLKDPVVITHGMGAVLISLSVILMVGEIFERPVFGEEFALEFPEQAVLFLVLGTVVMFYAYATGQIGFGGAQYTGSINSISVVTGLAMWLQGPLFAISWLGAFNAPARPQRLLLVLCGLVQAVMTVPMGRRMMVFSVVLTLMAFRLGRRRLNIRPLTQVLMAAVIICTLYVTSIAFFYMRIAGWASGKMQISTVERIQLALDYFETRSYDEVSAEFSSNVEKRTFVLGFLAEVNDYAARDGYGYGADFWGESQMAIPSAIFPDKDLSFREEGFADQMYGTTYYDEANSVMTTGAIDFGMLGMIGYPLFFCWVFRKYVEVLGQTIPTFVVTIIVFAVIASLLQPETVITDYLVQLRNGILFGGVVWGVLALPIFRLRSKERV